MPRFDFAWLALWGTLSSAWCLTASGQLSATFDEPFYLRAGITSWRTGSNHDLMRAGTMPLPVDVQYLPVYLCERIRGEPFDLDRDFHAILPVARAVNLGFWWVLLTYGMLLARMYGGTWAGRVAVVLLATEPSLLGHACLATTDIALTALVLGTAYHFQRGRESASLSRWFVPGVLYGVAITAKVSALTFVPIVMVALEVPRWVAAGLFRRPEGVGCLRHLRDVTGPYWADAVKVFVVGMAFAWGYCGTDWEAHPRFVDQANALPEDGRWTPLARWAAHELAVFPNAGQAFHYQFKHNVRGHGAYLQGEWHRRAVWYYFPVVLAVKLTVPVLLLAVLLLLRPRSLATPVGLAALGLFLFSLNCRVQIGVRLVFPLVAILLLTLAVGLARVAVAWTDRTRWLGLGCLTAALLGPTWTAWPDALRYANELWGGPEQTYRHLSDSNADWGQGVKELDAWTVANGLPTAWVWYYGSDPSVLYDPERLLALHHLTEQAVRRPEDLGVYVRGKVVAVSTSLLFGDPRITPTMPHAVAFFQARTPIGRTGTYFIYDFRDMPGPP